MIELENVIVHILDCEHNTCITSTSCMEQMSVETDTMLKAKAEKVFHSSSKKSGSFKEGSQVKAMLNQLQNNELTFVEASQKIATMIFDNKMKYALYSLSDIVIALILQEGRRYLFVLENACQEGMTHHLIQNGTDIVNEIIPYHTLISTNMMKSDRAFLIELSDFSLHCVENKVEIEGEKVNFFADVILQSITTPSYKENVKNISKITEAMSEKYEIDEVELMPKMKSIMLDNVEKQIPIQTEEIANLLFAEKPLAKAEFKDELKKKGVPNEVQVEYVKPAKIEKVQKIKTDKGIEISIPIDYMNSKEFVEFKNQEDGTISIQLKNIIHITSK